MKVLLINPPSTGIFTTFGVSLPPMGLLYLAASLEQAGFTVQIKDLQIDPKGLSAEDLKSADFIGITSDTTRIEKAMKIAARAAAMGRPVAMGGPHPQFMAEEILSTGHVHYIIKGEGEWTLLNLLGLIEAGGDPAGLPGIVFSDHGRVVETPAAPPPDVSMLPFPARHLVDIHRYTASVAGVAVTPVVTSRGCPGACSFCSSSSFFGQRWRSRSAESVLEELETLYHDYGFRGVAFVDDNFSLSPVRVIEICNGILARGLDLKWWNFSRVDTIARNPNMLKAMAAAGAQTVFLGIESAGAEALMASGKIGQGGETAQAVSLLRSNGIEVYGSYVIGHLNERREDVERTIDLAIELDTNVAQFSILTPYPGATLYSELKERIFIRRWKFYDGLHLVFHHPFINRHRLQILLLQAYIKFYRRSNKSRAHFNDYRNRQNLTMKKILRCVRDLFF
jgi:anaerobic magnesium-protoporphyrin IX monomethyl ester cyclase